MAVDQGELRQRSLPHQASPPEQASEKVKSLNAQERASTKGSNEKKTFGRTPSGVIFTVPETHDMVSQLLSPTEPKNFGDVVVVAILALHILLLYLLPQSLRVPAFALVYFFWRGCYNAGIGYLLHEQSHHRRLVRWAEKFKLFANPAKGDNPRPALYKLLKREMEAKIPRNYNFDDAPIEFNTWLLFRRLTDLVLMSDFVSYCCFAVAASNNPPPGESIMIGVLRWSVGVGLVLFNLWVKLDAHRVVKDYAWYWGDFFFLVDQELTFDGVFEMAPHPMYSVGYAGFYGISLMAASYQVLFVSIVAHAAQFAFLVWVENPHIDKTYSPPAPKGRLLEGMSVHDAPSSTPPLSPTSFGGEAQLHNSSSRAKPAQMHNLVGLSNMDFHRLTDTTALLLQFYLLLLTLATPSTSGYQLFFVLLAAAWRLWYSIGIGFILNRQSLKKYWTRHFVKYGESTSEAWRQWQGLYHISMTMTYGSFIAAAWKVYTPPTDWGSGMALLRHILGLSMVTLQIWTAVSIYESLGEFGWFFGDFFFDHAPKLTYSGIYRFLNNPERVIGLAGLWGAVLITNSKAIFALALLSHVVSLAFIQFVERPHMQKLYGRSIREDSGLSRSLRKSLPPGIWKWQGSVDKMLEESLDFVEDFIESARPRIAAGVNTLVKDSTSLFKHPTRLTITRLEPDMAGYDPKDYSIEITNGTQSSDGKAITFSYGEPVRARWTAPLNHSNKDWVGLYRVADNALWTVTRASSAGRWVATNPDQYDNPDFGTGSLTQDVRVAGASRQDGELSDFFAGEMEFLGSKLFWTEGVFEFRYHHNGKHNVMAISRAFEVRIGRFDEDDVELDSQGLARDAIEQELLPLVWNCCDRDPEIAPNTPTEGYGSVLARDSKYARRIVYAVGRMFGIEFAHEVVLADGNIRNLAWRICNAKQVLVCLCNNPVSKSKSDEGDTKLTEVHEKAPYSMSASRGRNTPTK